MSVHMVAKGETLGRIAKAKGVTVKAILQANPSIKNPDLVRVGHKLQIPGGAPKGLGIVSKSGGNEVPSVGDKNIKSPVGEDEDEEDILYSIKPGDTLGRIASVFGVGIQDILRSNPQIKDPDKISVGMKILIPQSKGKPTGKPAMASSPKPGIGGIKGALGAALGLGAAKKTISAPVAPAPPKASPKTGKAQDRSPAKNLKVSDRGVRFIARWEGFEPNLYDDAANHCTIGFGHLVHFGPCNDLDAKKYPKGISKGQALSMLKKDANTAIRGVRQVVKVDLSQGEFDALVSWVFNLGAGNLKSSTMLKKLNKGDYEAVPKEMARWTKAGGKQLKGLVRRRKAEGELFSKGVYGAV